MIIDALIVNINLTNVTNILSKVSSIYITCIEETLI